MEHISRRIVIAGLGPSACPSFRVSSEIHSLRALCFPPSHPHSSQGCGCSAGSAQGSAGLCAPELGPISGIQALLLRITEQPGHTVWHHHAKGTSKCFNALWCFLLALQIGTGVTVLCWQSYIWSASCKKEERTIQGTIFKLRSLELVFKLLNHSKISLIFREQPPGNERIQWIQDIRHPALRTGCVCKVLAKALLEGRIERGECVLMKTMSGR